MKATLQFAYFGWNNVGALRSKKRKAYTVEAITGEGRESEVETVAYRVNVTSLALELHSQLLNSGSWPFRIYFADEDLEVDLGTHPYTIDYDGLVVQNGIEYHQVSLSFIIRRDEYSDYAVPVAP